MTEVKLRICVFSRSMRQHSSYHTPALARIARVLRDLGHEVTALTTSLPEGKAGILQEDGCQVHYLAGTNWRRSDKDFWRASAAEFDRLHAERPFDLVVGRGSSTWGFFAHSRNAGAVPVVSHQGTYPRWLHQLESRLGAVARWIAYPLALVYAPGNRRVGHCLQRSDRVVCNSPQLADAFRRAYWWHPPRTVWVTYGVDLTPFHPAAPQPGQPPRLLSLGRLTWDKGILPMIDMLARLKNREAVLEAVGPATPRVRQAVLARAARQGVSARYSAPGPIPNQDVPGRMAGAAAFIFPSTHAEGLPKVVLEAMSAGVPVVAYRLPVLEGLIEDGVAGFQVPIRSVAAMAERVDLLLSDPDLAAQMGAAARHKIETEFTPKAINAKWQVLLAEVVAEAKLRQPR